MLNASQIIQEGLLKLEHTKGKPAQVGYDVSLRAVNQVGDPNRLYNLTNITDFTIGKVLKGETKLTTYTPVETISLDSIRGWLLYPGVYDLTFNEGCKIPANRVGFIKQRSSLYRNGATINSPVFDPGFETEFMGSLMYLHTTLFIEQDARVAQIYFHECEPAELYNGQWQNDKQRQA